MEMHERIKELRKSCKLTQEAFGNRLSITRDMVNNIERGRVEIKDHIVKLICSEFSINEEWLRYGNGEMKVKTPTDTMEQLRREFSLDEFSYNLVYEYLKLGNEQRKAVRDFFYNVVDSGIIDEVASAKDSQKDEAAEHKHCIYDDVPDEPEGGFPEDDFDDISKNAG